MPTSEPAEASAVKNYLTELQDRITAAVEQADSAKFRRDTWARPEGGGGESRILSDGAVFERAGVSVSHVFGDKLPPSASNLRPEIAGAPSRRWDCRWCFIRVTRMFPPPIATSAFSWRGPPPDRKSGGSAAVST